MNNLENSYAIATIDNTAYTLDVFSEETIDDKLISTNLRLPGGSYTITNFELYTNDVLVAEDTNPHDFTVEVSFTIELPITLTTVEGAPQKMLFNLEGLDYGFAYSKATIPEELPPPLPTTVQMIGILGIPDNEMHLYETDIQYKRKDVLTMTKAIFAIQHYHVHADGTVDDMVFHNIDWLTNDPLEFEYVKSGNPLDKDVFKIQMYRVMLINGTKQMASVVHGGLEGEWQFTLNGDEDFELNDKGIVEFSYLPTGWLSDSPYEFEYTVYPDPEDTVYPAPED